MAESTAQTIAGIPQVAGAAARGIGLETVGNGLTAAGDWVAGIDPGYVPQFTFDGVRNSPGVVSGVGNALGFAAEQGLRSLPQVGAMFIPGGAPVVITGEAGRIATERARNDNRPAATMTDVAIAAPAAALSLGDKFVASRALGLGGAGGGGSLAGRIGGTTALSGGTEGVQEGAEYLAGNAGTVRGATVAGLGENMAAGALAGGILGGGVRAGAEGVQAARAAWESAPIVTPAPVAPAATSAPQPAPVAPPAPAPAPEPPPSPEPQPAPAPAPVAPPPPVPAPAPPAPPAPRPGPSMLIPPPVPAPTSSEPGTPIPAERRTVTATGREVETEHQIVPLASLIPASGDLQPRDRAGRAASDIQIAEIAGNLDPQRLLSGPDADRGSPIVGPDSIIESGNGRIAALRRVAETDPARYQAYVEAVRQAGYEVDGIDTPVLIRRRVTPMDDDTRRQFVTEANASPVMRMSPVEQAGIDGRAMTPAILSLYDPEPDAGVQAASNVRFVRSMIEAMPSTERASLVQSDGTLSVEGVRRLQAAILSRAYTAEGDAGRAARQTLARALENPSDDTRSMTSGLLSGAPRWAQMRASVTAGQINQRYDTTDDLMSAVALVRDVRASGRRIEDALNQQDAFNQISPMTEAWARTMVAPNGRPAGSARVAEVMRRYAEDAERQPGDDGNLFGDPAAAPADILRAAYTATWRQGDGRPNQTNLLDDDVAADQSPDEDPDAVLADAPDSDGKAPSVGGNQRPLASLGPQSMEQMSQTMRQSNFRDAFQFAGYDVDKADTLPFAAQVRILRDAMKKRFGLRMVEATDTGVQGRHSVDQMLDLHRNLRWLSATLAIPEQMIGLGDRLALRLISPSQLRAEFKSKAWGLYAPATRDIVIPGRSNSFGHEFGHALDHWLGERFSALPDVAYATKQTRTMGLDPAIDVQHSFIDLMNALFFDDAALAARVIQLQAEASRVDKAGNPTKAAQVAQMRIDAVLEGRSKLRNERSDFAQNAARRDPGEKYISKPVEMFARAFESYLSRRAVGDHYMSTEALTKPEKAYRQETNPMFADLYPQAGDRVRIMLAFDGLFSALRREQAFGDGVASTRPDDLDMLDPTKLHRQATVAPAAKPLFERLRQDYMAMKNFGADFRTGLGQTATGHSVTHPLLERARANAAQYGSPWRRKIGAKMAPMAAAYERFGMGFENIFSSKRAVMKRLEERQPTPEARKIFRDIRDHLTTDPGTGRLVREGYEDQVYRDINRYSRLLQSTLKKNNLERMDAPTNALLRDVLTQVDGQPVAAPANITSAAADIRRHVLTPLAYAMREAGINVGMVTRQGYFPRVWELPAIFAKPADFKVAGQEAYRVVFENTVGPEGGVDLEAFVEALKSIDQMGTSNVIRTDPGGDPQPADILRPVDQQIMELKLALKERARIERDKKMDDDQKIEALEEMDEKITTLVDEIYEPVRDAYALGRAEALTNRLIVGDATDFESLGPETGFTKARSLPPEADKIFERFYQSDVVSVVSDYTRGASQRIAYIQRFGTDQVSPDGKREGNKLQGMLEEAGRKGAFGDDIRSIRDMVEDLTGRARDSTPASINHVNNIVTTAGMMSLLPRAVWSATFEPFTAYAKTGDAKVMVKSVHSFVQQAMGRGDSAAVRELAEAIGVSTNSQFEAILSSHLNGMYSGDTKWATISSNYQRLTFQQQIFNIQRASQTRVGHYWITTQIDNAMNASGFEASRAKAELRELGIDDSEIKAVHTWLKIRTAGKLPGPDDVRADNPAAQLYASALYRWVDQTILQPSRSDTTILASKGLLSAPFKLLSFSYSWMRQVPVTMLNRVSRDAKLRQAEGDSEMASWLKSGGQEAMTAAIFAGSLMAGHFMLAVLRESIFNSDKFDEEVARGNEIPWLLEMAFSRAGLTGTFDPLVQAVRGIRYSRDLSSLAAGPYAGYFLDGAQALLEVPFGRNSANTSTTERKAAEAAYTVLGVPALATLATGVAFAAGRMPGPLGKGIAVGTGLGLMWATSRDAVRAVGDLAGERPQPRR